MLNTETAGKRDKVTKREWLMADGSGTKDPREAHSVKIEVLGGAGTIAAAPADFSEQVQNALALFGLNIVLTNTMGGLKGDEAFEAMAARLETLQNGEWTDRKGADGPRISQLVAAVIAAFRKRGEERDEDTMTAKIKGMEAEARKSLAEDPEVKLELDRIKMEAAQERFRKSEEAARAAAGGAAPASGLAGL